MHCLVSACCTLEVRSLWNIPLLCRYCSPRAMSRDKPILTPHDRCRSLSSSCSRFPPFMYYRHKSHLLQWVWVRHKHSVCVEWTYHPHSFHTQHSIHFTYFIFYQDLLFLSNRAKPMKSYTMFVVRYTRYLFHFNIMELETVTIRWS